MEEYKSQLIPNDIKNPEFSEFVERILKRLSEKNQIINSQALEIESLNSMIAYYREQFPPKKCETCKASFQTMESLESTLRKSEKERELKDLQLRELRSTLDDSFKKMEELKAENRRFSNENRLKKSQIQDLKDKNSVNEKFIETLKRDLKSSGEDRERVERLLKESEEKLQTLQVKLLERPTYDISRSSGREDILLEDELEKFQMNLDNLEALNQNIQGSLGQFQISHIRQNSRNISSLNLNPQLAPSRSIDLSKRPFVSPQNGKTTSFSFVAGVPQYRLKTSMVLDQSSDPKSDETEEKRGIYYTPYIPQAIETINEEEKDLELDQEHNPKNVKKQHGIFKKKCKSIIEYDPIMRESTSSKGRKRAKSVVISEKPLDPAKLNELFSLSKLETDCFGVLKILIDGNLTIMRDFQNKLSLGNKRVVKNISDIEESLNSSKIGQKDIAEFITKQKSFMNGLTEDFKDYLLISSDLIKFALETSFFSQKGQQLCENLSLAVQEKEIDLKGKLEEIVRLHENIISLETKEISFDENINEIYEKYMKVFDERDTDWVNFDRLKKFTKIIEGYVQERLQIKSINKDIESLSREIEEIKGRVKDYQRECQRKSEVINKNEMREKLVRKERDFFYSQLMFIKKKVEFIGLKSSFGFWGKIKVMEQELFGEFEVKGANEGEIQRILKKCQNLDSSVKTMIQNLVSYEENKGKEPSNYPSLK